MHVALNKEETCRVSLCSLILLYAGETENALWTYIDAVACVQSTYRLCSRWRPSSNKRRRRERNDKHCHELKVTIRSTQNQVAAEDTRISKYIHTVKQQQYSSNVIQKHRIRSTSCNRMFSIENAMRCAMLKRMTRPMLQTDEEKLFS